MYNAEKQKGIMQMRGITKRSMLNYMKSPYTPQEDVDWFKGIVSDPENQKIYYAKSRGGEYADIDTEKVKKLFCERFYPEQVKERPVHVQKVKTYIEQVMEL